MKLKSFKFAGMTIHEGRQRLLFALYHHYDQREASNIADLVMEHVTGWNRIDRVLNKSVIMSASMQADLDKYAGELSGGKPVQYVLHEAWFCGLRFYVDEHVLIPRPETEELVDWIARDIEAGKSRHPSILDVGTGSGCIAVALQKKFPRAKVAGCDVSQEALKIASKNAADNDVNPEFFFFDILGTESLAHEYDIIVSNPPYIPASEKNTIRANVLSYEPHLALFVDEQDPLIFYRRIAEAAANVMYFEMHEDFASRATEMFRSQGFRSITVKKDMQGKDRMIRVEGH